jgi:hypothetical protein
MVHGGQRREGSRKETERVLRTLPDKAGPAVSNGEATEESELVCVGSAWRGAAKA